ncbi:ATP-binding cassette domain-containing protein [Mesorhizobium sp. ES1-4]|uniref:ATP-binding cassette domain-containing protein n=1 Tax=Mesorhizobium sp. ES1-4 TaxID=2876627 RepID=UPI001CCD3F56|nr:ATP-binding cassette domain-containing protein [Mesorhizobium sp. ES1-4]MBZ9798472.1 ATP-binding cassette domain-containing protein [Mesorhizobium sp. ES1-4]
MARIGSRIAFTGLSAIFVGEMIFGRANWMLFGAALGSLILGSVTGLATDRVLASTELKVANGLLGAARRALVAASPADVQAMPAGTLIAGLQRYPQAIASLAVGHRLASIMLGLGPSAAAAAIAAVSWQAALALVVLTPVMIVFFVLVGGAIRSGAEAQEKAFGRLAAQFADRIRALPTILGNHGLARERRKLETRLDTYASGTMSVLRIAFLNAGIIDFFASLSIAVLAVFLGLGHLKLMSVPGFAGLQLWQSLFILMIAPEYFAPFRRYAEQYHAKAGGVAAATALDTLVLAARPRSIDFETAILTPDLIHAASLLPRTGLVAITGPSGSGKSTLLRHVAGIGTARSDGSELDRPEIAWCSTEIHVPEGTLGDAIGWGTGQSCRTRLLLAAGNVGLLDDVLLPGGLDALITAGGENLSGGQRVRIGLARALASGRAILADEPTAKLDPVNAAMVRRALAGASRGRLVVVATHDRDLAMLAGKTIEAGPASQQVEENAA